MGDSPPRCERAPRRRTGARGEPCGAPASHSAGPEAGDDQPTYPGDRIVITSSIAAKHRPFAVFVVAGLVFSLLLPAAPLAASAPVTADALDRARDQGVTRIPTIDVNQAAGTVGQRLASAAQT